MTKKDENALAVAFIHTFINNPFQDVAVFIHSVLTHSHVWTYLFIWFDVFSFLISMVGGRPLRTYWESKRVGDALFGNGATSLSFRLKRQEVCDAIDFNLISIPLWLFFCIVPSSKDLLIWLSFFLSSSFPSSKHINIHTNLPYLTFRTAISL